MKISCVVDNQAKFQSNFYAEHGFSLMIHGNDENMLMDTGKTPMVLKRNLDLMGIKSVDRVIISHGHYDHTGGIPVLKDMEALLMMHPQALIPKYAVGDGKSRYIGFPENLDLKTLKTDFLTETTRINSNMWIFNHVESWCDFETIPAYLKVKKDDKFLKDEFNDELNLVIKTDKGLVVLSGCAHRGMVNILYSAREYFQDEIYGVIGGSHLVQAPSKRIKQTIDEFKKISPETIALGHCTGFEALCRFKKEFKDKFIPLESGAEIIV
jgi:7,8-dihydropterin-6-yl-methyl-4-(beta-D-ribofuranosyl)aminobenzene 5'-phosphate synthase